MGTALSWMEAKLIPYHAVGRMPEHTVSEA